MTKVLLLPLKILDRMLAYILVLLIRIYQIFISPMISRNCCAFYPSCSEYAKQAVLKFPVYRSIPLICKRLAKCHPFAECGDDTLPDV